MSLDFGSFNRRTLLAETCGWQSTERTEGARPEWKRKKTKRLLTCQWWQRDRPIYSASSWEIPMILKTLLRCIRPIWSGDLEYKSSPAGANDQTWHTYPWVCDKHNQKAWFSHLWRSIASCPSLKRTAHCLLMLSQTHDTPNIMF